MCKKHSILFGAQFSRYLFPVGFDESEDKTSIHDWQEIIEEEGQAGVEPFHQLKILKRQ